MLQKSAIHGAHLRDGEIIGTVPAYHAERFAGESLTGRFFNDIEYEDQKNVCVLSASVAAELFPVGQRSAGGNGKDAPFNGRRSFFLDLERRFRFKRGGWAVRCSLAA